MSRRFRITGIEKISSSRLIFELEPVEGNIPDDRPLRMSLEFAEDGDSFTGKWTNWFRLQNAKSRRPDDFVGVRSQPFWQTVMTHNRIDMYQAYLRLHPGGIYTAVARDRVAALGGVLPTPSSPTVSATAAVSADTPATTTTTPVDPLVGIWRWRWNHTQFTDECYLGVGITNDGTFKAKGWESDQSLRAFGEVNNHRRRRACRALANLEPSSPTRTPTFLYRMITSVTALGPHDLKGFSKPVEVYSVTVREQAVAS